MKDTIGPLPPISLTTKDVTRYKMAWRALKFAWAPKRFFCEGRCHNESFRNTKRNPLTFVQRCSDRPFRHDLTLPIRLGFITAGFIYGGLHAMAWFAHFESSTQQLLWRISACVVMGGFPVCFVLLVYLESISPHISHRLHLHDISLWSWSIASALIGLAYVLARVYLVVECFINLSHLPAGVYEVPSWASYFPHIS